MTIPICVSDDGCLGIVDGKLTIMHAGPDAANPGATSCEIGGLRYNHLVPTLTRTLPSASGTGTHLFTQAEWDVTTYDTGSGPGTWTINAGGSVTLNVDGIYALSGYGGVSSQDDPGKLRGQRFRILANGTAVVSFEMIDYTDTIDLSTTDDGPEACAAVTRRFAAGTVITWHYLVGASVAGTYDVLGQFDICFLGRTS